MKAKKLSQYKKDSGLTYKSIASRIKRPLRTVKNWCDAGVLAIVSEDGKDLMAVQQPSKMLWESRIYKQSSKRLGINQ